MIIYFLRHASAGQSKKNAKQDEKRSLDKEGIEQCTDVGRALSALDVQVDTIISSPLKRATQTASLVANELGHEGKLLIEKALRPDAKFEDFQELLHKHSGKDAIMVVGHNPTLSEFVSLLISDGASDTAVDLRKGAVAKVDSKQRLKALHWCLTPRAIRAIQETVATKSLPKSSRK